MSATRKALLRGKRRVYDGFFKLDELTVSRSLSDGTMSPDQPFLVFERGDAAAALLYNVDTLEVILVDQFKAGTLEKGQSNGWILETMAGMIRSGGGGTAARPPETPQDAVIRETFEETGYRISNPPLITSFFSSPGGTSERIHLFYAEVSNADKSGPGGGNREEGEDIEIVTMLAEDLFEMLREGALRDPKLIIAAYWLKDHLVSAPLKKRAAHKFALKSDPSLIMGYKTGDIMDVRGVDAWVNSENTGMVMDRVANKSISARIRDGGAEKDPGGKVTKDVIDDAIRDLLDGRASVSLGTVIDTTSGSLLASNDVKRIFHVATVEGLGGKGFQASLEKVAEYATNVLEAVQKKNRAPWNRKYKSILMPMFGAGDGGLKADDVAPKLVEAAINFFEKKRPKDLKEIYFLAYTTRDQDACEKAMRYRADLERLS